MAKCLKETWGVYKPVREKEYRKAFIGLDAFDSSIEYHDQDLTDVYVVFTYNKAWEQKSSIDVPWVEMIITMATSRTQILGEKKAPIKFTETGYGAFSDLILYGKNGEVLNKLTADQIKGEFAWFCTSPYLLKNQHEQEPLITCDLETLANLSFKNSYIDIIQQ
ncbi:hypothetical protein [Rickettsia honei]|uniref:hypothetical protein n=1 Tax=Rickettsia honei TaxID=37816 RepID=UPI00030B19F9|nr:hypothetical protein [Rickettsia honei]